MCIVYEYIKCYGGEGIDNPKQQLWLGVVKDEKLHNLIDSIAVTRVKPNMPFHSAALASRNNTVQANTYNTYNEPTIHASVIKKCASWCVCVCGPELKASEKPSPLNARL